MSYLQKIVGVLFWRALYTAMMLECLCIHLYFYLFI